MNKRWIIGNKDNERTKKMKIKRKQWDKNKDEGQTKRDDPKSKAN